MPSTSHVPRSSKTDLSSGRHAAGLAARAGRRQDALWLGGSVLALSLLALLAVPGAEASTSVGGTISTDTTWTLAGSPYIVTSSISVKGTDGADGVTTLTVEPGVEVLFRPWTRLEVGGCCSTADSGALVADGTAASPIVFTSDQSAGAKTRGYWGPLQFNAYAADGASSMQNVTVEYGGASTAGLYLANNQALAIFRDNLIQEHNNQGVYLSSATLSVEGSTIHGVGGNGAYALSSTLDLVDSTLSGAGGHGAYLIGSTVSVQGSTLQANAQYGIYTASGTATVNGSLFDSNTQRPLRVPAASPFHTNVFVGNGIGEVELLGGIIGQDQRLSPLSDAVTGASLPYVATGSLTVRGTDGPDGVTTLTIDPGVTVRFGFGAGLEIGYCCLASLPGALVAEGTAADPILFTSNQPAGAKTRGHWGPVSFPAYAHGSTVLENTTIEYGGYHTASLNIASAGPHVRDVVIREGKNQGVSVNGAASTLQDVVIDGVDGNGVYSSSLATVRNVTIEDVGGHGIYTFAASPLIEEVTIQGAGSYGLYTASGRPDLVNVTIQDVAQRPLRIHADSRFSSTILATSGIQEIELMGGIVGRDQHYVLRSDAITGAAHTYVVLGTIHVRGTDGPDGVTTLIVDPGVTLRFGFASGLEVGYCCLASLPGALVAEGTATQPILFTSNQAAGSQTRGYWGPVSLQRYLGPSTVLENATIEYGGYHTASLNIGSPNPHLRDVLIREGKNHGVSVNGAAFPLQHVVIDGVDGNGVSSSSLAAIRNVTIEDVGNHGVYTWGSSPLIEDVTIQRAVKYGVYTASGRPDLANVTIQDVGQRPLRIHADSRFATATFGGSGIPEIELMGGLVDRDQHYALSSDAVTGVRHTYIALSTITVRGTDGADGVTTLTIDPGVTLRFGFAAGLEVSYCCLASLPGALVAQGTAAEPILFTSNQPAGSQTRGYWGPINLHRYTHPSTVLENATIEYGGYHTAALNSARTFAIHDLVIRESKSHGLQLSTTHHTLHNLTISGVQGTGIHLASGDLVLRDTDITGTGGHGVYLWGASPLLERVNINGTGQYGVYTASGVVSLADSTIHDAGTIPLRVHLASRFQDTAISSAGVPRIELLGATLATDQDLPVLIDQADGAPLAYVLLSSSYVRGTDGADGVTTLTIEPGVEMRMARYASLEVGYCCSTSLPGALVARGTAEAPIVFTSDQPVGSETPRYWGRIGFDVSARASALENVTIAYGGYGESGGLFLNRAGPDVRSNHIHATGAIGIRTYLVPSGTSITDNHVHGVDTGLHIQSGSGLIVNDNHVNATKFTARLLSHSGSVFTGNTFTSASGVMSLDTWSRDNLIHDNVLLREDGGGPAVDDGSGNRWYIEPVLATNVVGGPYQAGNVYANYRGNDTTNPSDGLGDTDLPHPITGTAGATDPYPLVPPGRWIPDTELPVTTLTLDGTRGAAEWWVSPVDVTLEATDTGTGVDQILYQLDDGAEEEYTAPFNVSTDGRHTLVYHARDKAGNVEEPQLANVSVDTLRPVLAVAPEATGSDLCFVLDASDATSGLATLTWSVTNSTGHIVTNSTGVRLENISGIPGRSICAGIDVDGTYRISAMAGDAAGHVTAAVTDLLVVDVTGPIVDLQQPQHGEVYAGSGALAGGAGRGAIGHATVIKEVEVIAEASDIGSGVSHGELWIDGALVANETGGSYRWTVGPGLAPGEHVLAVRVYDHAGHVTEVVRHLLFVGASL